MSRIAEQLVVVSVAGALLIVGAIISTALRAKYYPQNKPRLEALFKRAARVLFLSSLVPLGIWFAIHFDIETLMKKIAPGPAVITLASGARSIIAKTGFDMAKPSNAIFFCGLGLLIGLIIGIGFYHISI